MPNPNPQHTPTDGLGVAAYVVLSGGTGASALSNPAGGTPVHPGGLASPINGQGIGATEGGVYPVAQYAMTLSLSAAGSYETVAVLTAACVDVKNNTYPGVLVLTAAANASAGTTVYTGTITGGGANAYAGMYLTVSGFVTNTVNNGSFLVVASTATTLTLANAAGVAETNAATAYATVNNFTAHSYNDPAAGSPAWYNPSNFAGYNPNVASVVASGANDATITVTALAVGQAVIEVAFPTFDNSIGTDAQAEDEPDMFIYVQVLVTVIP